MRSQRAPKTRPLQTLADQIVRTCPAMFFDIGSCANQGMPSKKIFLSRNIEASWALVAIIFAGVQPSWPNVRPQIIQCDTRDQARCEGQREIGDPFVEEGLSPPIPPSPSRHRCPGTRRSPARDLLLAGDPATNP